jgi:hypothetical protein
VDDQFVCRFRPVISHGFCFPLSDGFLAPARMHYRPTQLTLVLLFVLAACSLTAGETNFIRIKPFSGISLEVPQTWKAVDEQTKGQVATAIEALFDANGVRRGVAPNASTLFAITPPLQDVDVNVTIVAELKSPFTQEQVRSFTREQLRAIGSHEQNAIKQMIEPLQARLLSFSEIRREVVGGKVALVYQAVTSDSEDQQRTINSMVFYLGDRKFTITTLHAKAGIDPWSVILEKIRSSLRFDAESVHPTEALRYKPRHTNGTPVAAITDSVRRIDWLSVLGKGLAAGVCVLLIGLASWIRSLYKNRWSDFKAESASPTIALHSRRVVQPRAAKASSLAPRQSADSLNAVARALDEKYAAPSPSLPHESRANSNSSATRHITIDRNARQFGPFTPQQVNAYLASGQLLPTDFAWHEGAPQWMPLSDIEGIIPPLPSDSKQRAGKTKVGHPNFEHRPRRSIFEYLVLAGFAVFLHAIRVIYHDLPDAHLDNFRLKGGIADIIGTTLGGASLNFGLALVVSLFFKRRWQAGMIAVAALEVLQWFGSSLH